MLFIIKNNKYKAIDQLRATALLDAYYIIENYPMHAADIIMDNFIQQQYSTSLKNMCIKLLLNLTYYKGTNNDLVLLFKDKKYDTIAKLITFGNGAIPGSKILQIALSN